MDMKPSFHELLIKIDDTCVGHDLFEVVVALTFIARENAAKMFNGDFDKADAYIKDLFSNA